jgi:hypothetical protein
MEKLQKCVNFILTVPVFFATSCINKLCQIGEDAYVYVNYHIKKQNNQQ